MSADQRTSRVAVRAGVVSLVLALAAATIQIWSGRGSIAWVDFKQAMEQAQAMDMPVYVDVMASWCAPCRAMDGTTFRDDSVRAVLSGRFIPARVDLDDPVEGSLAKNAYGVEAVPTSLVITPQGRVLARHIGYLGPDSLLQWLRAAVREETSQADRLETAAARARDEHSRILALILSSTTDVEAATSTLDWMPIRVLLERTKMLPVVVGPSDSAALKRLPPAPAGAHLAGVLLCLTPTLEELDRAPLTQRTIYDETRMLGLLSSVLQDSTRSTE